jgi:hypothetical protein
MSPNSIFTPKDLKIEHKRSQLYQRIITYHALPSAGQPAIARLAQVSSLAQALGPDKPTLHIFAVYNSPSSEGLRQHVIMIRASVLNPNDDNDPQSSRPVKTSSMTGGAANIKFRAVCV